MRLIHSYMNSMGKACIHDSSTSHQVHLTTHGIIRTTIQDEIWVGTQRPRSLGGKNVFMGRPHETKHYQVASAMSVSFMRSPKSYGTLSQLQLFFFFLNKLLSLRYFFIASWEWTNTVILPGQYHSLLPQVPKIWGKLMFNQDVRLCCRKKLIAESKKRCILLSHSILIGAWEQG